MSTFLSLWSLSDWCFQTATRPSPPLPTVTQNRALSLGTCSQQQADLAAALAGTSRGQSLESRQTFSNLTPLDTLVVPLARTCDTAKSRVLTGGQCEWESGKMKKRSLSGGKRSHVTARWLRTHWLRFVCQLSVTRCFSFYLNSLLLNTVYQPLQKSFSTYCYL